MMLAYAFLAVAIAFEVVGTSLLQASHGATRIVPTAVGLTAYALAFVLLAQSVRELPVSVAYALWAGLGTATIVVISLTVLGETLSAAQLSGLGLIIVGVVIVHAGGAA